MGELPPQDGRNLYEALETETLTTRFHCHGSLEPQRAESAPVVLLRKCDTALLFALEVLITSSPFVSLSFYCPILVIDIGSSAADDRMCPKTPGLIWS